MAWLLAFLGLLLGVCAPAAAEDLSADQVRSIIAAATPGTIPDLSRKSLELLDLSGLDFKHAKLQGANLYGAKLVDANLAGADLSGAILNLAWIMRADFRSRRPRRRPSKARISMVRGSSHASAVST